MQLETDGSVNAGNVHTERRSGIFTVPPQSTQTQDTQAQNTQTPKRPKPETPKVSYYQAQNTQRPKTPNDQ